MAFKKANKKATETNREYLDISQYKVQNVRVVTDTMVTFTLRGHGHSLYGMKLCEGKNGMFIAPPSQKGKDGKYYNHYAVYLSEDDEKKLIDTVCKMAGEDDFVDTKDSELPFE